MKLKELGHAWDEFAEKDAMWAVLTGPHGEGRAWDREAFFRTGVEEIDATLRRVAEVGGMPGTERALDFGCGLGRLTQPLAERFSRADGVDISEAMIQRARSLNTAGERCHYHVNPADNLALFPDRSFDFAYSSIVLQHMEPRYSRQYIKEFLRLLKPGGVVVFQIPGEFTPPPVLKTRDSSPLPPGDCRAAIVVPQELRVAPGELMVLKAMVRNLGTRTWPTFGDADGQYSIRLGNHWRSGFLRRMLAFNDRRGELTHDLAPGEEVDVELQVNAPAATGRYVLELDMVQESVRWFAEAGSPVARVRVDVDQRFQAVEGLPARMEMYGIPRPEVESLVRGSGGELLAVDADDAPGPGWTSYRYFVRRTA